MNENENIKEIFIVDRIGKSERSGEKIAVLETEEGGAVSIALSDIGCIISEGDVLVKTGGKYFVDSALTEKRKQAALDMLKRIAKSRHTDK